MKKQFQLLFFWEEEVLKDGEKAFKKIQELVGQESTQKPSPNSLQGTFFQ